MIEGFDKMDEKFIEKMLDPAYRSIHIPKLEKARFWNFIMALLASVGGLIEFISTRRFRTFSFAFLVFWWAAFIFIDFYVKFIKLLDRLKAEKTTEQDLNQAKKSIQKEEDRSIMFVFGTITVLALCFFLWLFGVNFLIALKHYAATGQGHKWLKVLSLFHL